VAAIDMGHHRHGCGVVVGFIAIGVGWWWVFTTPLRAHRSAGAGDMAQQQCIVEVVGGGSYGQRPSLPWVWGGDGPHCHWCWGNSDMAVGTGVMDSGGG